MTIQFSPLLPWLVIAIIAVVATVLSALGFWRGLRGTALRTAALAMIVAALAKEILTLNDELADIDAMISEKVTEHQHTQVLLSMPGFGPVLAAEFLGATGGDLTVFQTADRFAGVVGLAPAPRDSGRISGNHHRPRRYDRRLLRVFYLSGLSALKSCPASRGYYDRKRIEGKSHIQAMLSLARRRLNVLWAMLRDGALYTPMPVAIPLAA